MQFTRTQRELGCALLCAVALMTAGCGADRTAAAKSRPSGWPAVLRYNVSLGQEDPAARLKRTELLRLYLEQELGIPVEVTVTANYGGAIEAMRAKKLDATGLGPFAYLIASEKAGAEAIVTRGSNRDGNPGEYTGTLAVAGDSPIRSIEDLRAHSRELTVSFVDPASASGFLVQRAYLDSIGIDPERDFKKVVFSNNHIASAMTLKAGKTDIAAVEDYVAPLLVERGKLKPGDIRAIWTSPRIPNGPVAVRKDLPETLKRKLQDALVEMKKKAPEVYNNIRSRNARAVTPDSTYVRVTDAQFDGLRKMARDVKHIQLLEQ